MHSLLSSSSSCCLVTEDTPDTENGFKHQHFIIPQYYLLYPFTLCVTPVCPFTRL